MKLFFQLRSRPAAAFTLMEILVAVSIFTLVVLCMVTSQLFGLRVYTNSSAKLSAIADARKAMNHFRDHVRESESLLVGDYSSFPVNTSNAFPGVSSGLQQGNALEVFPTTNSTPFLIYYVDDSTNQLKLYDSSLDTTRVLANDVTNTVVFDAEDFQGNVLSNNQDNRVIRMTLEFYRREYFVGRTNYYNFYRLSMRATERSLP